MFKLCALVCVCDEWRYNLLLIHRITYNTSSPRQTPARNQWKMVLLLWREKKIPVTKYGYAQLLLECRDGSETFGSDIYFGTHFHFDFWHPGHRIHRKPFIRCSDPDSQSIGHGHIRQIESPAARESRYCHQSDKICKKEKAPTGKNPSWASKSLSSSRATNFWGRGISSILGCWEHFQGVYKHAQPNISSPSTEKNPS